MTEEKMLDLTWSVQQLCKQYPELIAVMQQLGFQDIVKPGMLATAGRFMTIPKGAAMKGIDMTVILDTLRQQGFKPTGI